MKRPPKIGELTRGQSDVLEFLELFIIKHGYGPSREEISAHFGWTSPNAAQCYLQRLKDRGFIDFKPRVARSIVLLMPPQPRKPK